MNPNAESKYLEKNLKNINIESLEYRCDFNPIFERNKRKFDQVGVRGILLANININEDLTLPLNAEFS